MTRADLTDITMVLDRSGSMSSMKAATIEAFNSFLKSQRTGAGEGRMSLIQFDDQYEVVYQAQPLSLASELTNETFVPRGSTALLDAMGKAMVSTGRRFSSMPEHERPGTVLFVTLTDGEENASHEYDLPKINTMISEQRDKYAWQFIFLAANQDAIATAAKMGISSSHAMTMAASPEGMAASMASVNRHMHDVRFRRAAGAESADFAFEEADRAAANPDDKD